MVRDQLNQGHTPIICHLVTGASFYCLYHAVESLLKIGSDPGRILRNLNGQPMELDGPAAHERECLSRQGELEVI